jgi:signal transduction histidine kinase
VTETPIAGGRAWSIKAFVVALIALSAIPLIVLIAALIFNFIQEERTQYHNAALQLAVSAANTLDRDLQGLVATGQALATSRMLALKNYEEFYKQALSVREITGAEVIYKEASGQQIVNTRLPWGSALPSALPPADRLALETKGPQISDLFMGATAGRMIVSVNIPVLANGDAVGLINLAVVPDRFLRLLQAEAIPPQWTWTVVGRDDRIIARSLQHDRLVGSLASELLRRSATGQQGMYVGHTLEGIDTLSAYGRSKLSGWRVAIGVPIAVVEAPLLSHMRNLLIATALSLLASLAFGGWLGSHLTRAVRRLADSALKMGDNSFEPSSPSRIKEVNDVGGALTVASDQLHQREAALRSFSESLEQQVQERTAELVQSHHKLLAEVAHREAVEDQLRQAQKMESIGQLTGGIAHDFNNFLAIIYGSLDMIRRRIERGEHGNLHRYLDAAREGSQRAATFTQRLLAFSRQQPLTPEPINVNGLVSGMSDLIGHSLGKQIQIETVLAAGIWLTHADQNQLEQSILNLAVNARDAMPEGGKLTIETANCHIDAKYVRENPAATSGQFVMIAVTDTGCGMSSEQIDKAFDPFFTTKPKGHGTGLGLSQVYGFVKQSGGHVKIYSEIGHGSTIRIYLPRFVGQMPNKDAGKIQSGVALPSGQETILVVEDEDGVRQLTVETVRELGYRVIEAADAKAALRIIDTEDIDLLFTDVVMPEINGRRLAEEAVRRRPKLKVLFTTGYTKNAVVHNGVLDPGVDMIGKPFTIDDLASKLREVLDRKDP